MHSLVETRQDGRDQKVKIDDIRPSSSSKSLFDCQILIVLSYSNYQSKHYNSNASFQKCQHKALTLSKVPFV